MNEREAAQFAELQRLIALLTNMLNESSEAIAEAASDQTAIGNLVDRWLREADDENLPIAVRVTYLDCAQGIIAVFRRE